MSTSRNAIRTLTFAALALGLTAAPLFLHHAPARAAAANRAFPSPALDEHRAAGTEQAVLAGGCFWGMEAVFESLHGVSKVVAGYSGGDAESAHYEMVSTGTTGHAESVQITYDPAKISYGTLLEIYFSVAHDPTQLDQQGPDAGNQYRSSIFYVNPEQQKIAQAYIAQLAAAHVYDSKIVTALVPLRAFYPAEAHHQHFVRDNPGYPYVVYEDLPKLAKLKADYPALATSETDLAAHTQQ